jgi:transposase, IS30 family
MASSVYTHFTLQQRRELHQLLKKDFEYREKQIQEGRIKKGKKPKKLYIYKDIGDILGKDKGSISREIGENSVKDRKTGQINYDPVKAHQKATAKKLYRPNCFEQRKIVESKFLRMNLEVFLPENSPEQIVGRISRYNEVSLKGKKMPSVSHTLIYEYLYSAQGQHLCKYLLTKRTKVKKWKKRTEAEKKAEKENCRILERISIENRPEEINDRSTPFHWETDILGSLKSVKDRI